MVLITLLVILGCISFSNERTIHLVPEKPQADDEARYAGELGDDNDVTVEDMRFTQEQWTLIQQQRADDGQRRRKRKAYRNVVTRWDEGVVPYIIEKGFSDKSIQIIHEAMDEWESFTCVRFRHANDRETSVKLFPTGGCLSQVGRCGRSGQILTLGNGCDDKGIVLHELGHTLGFFHEQSRPDRDSYIRIHYENIVPSMKYNFDRYSTKTIDTYGIPYDYESIMHYGQYYFSHNKQRTITAFHESDTKKIGNRYGLSYYDIHLANVMYNCNKSCSDKKYCHRGFLGKDCRCWCKGPSVEKPVVYCDNREAITVKPNAPRPTPTEVADSDAYCKGLAAAGFCTHDNYTRKICKKSCSHYSLWIPPYGDVQLFCVFWAGIGRCEKQPSFMLMTCKRCCAQLTSCADELPEMCQMHRRQCNSHDLQHIMTRFCARTCNSCAKKQRIASCEDLAPRTCSLFAIIGKCISEDPQIRNKMQDTCPKACGKCDNPRLKYTRCHDRISNCQTWYSFLNGSCDNDPFFSTIMKIFCRRTCKLC